MSTGLSQAVASFPRHSAIDPVGHRLAIASGDGNLDLEPHRGEVFFFFFFFFFFFERNF